MESKRYLLPLGVCSLGILQIVSWTAIPADCCNGPHQLPPVANAEDILGVSCQVLSTTCTNTTDAKKVLSLPNLKPPYHCYLDVLVLNYQTSTS